MVGWGLAAAAPAVLINAELYFLGVPLWVGRKMFLSPCTEVVDWKVWNGKSSLRLEWSNKYWTACMPPSFVDIGMCKLGPFNHYLFQIFTIYLPKCHVRIFICLARTNFFWKPKMIVRLLNLCNKHKWYN